MLKKFGNSFFWIQHVQIRLEHVSKHFYQKMPSQVTFSGYPASLYDIESRAAFFMIITHSCCALVYYYHQKAHSIQYHTVNTWNSVVNPSLYYVIIHYIMFIYYICYIFRHMIFLFNCLNQLIIVI